MIKIDNLTKIYKAKAKTECRAIDGISVTLIDNQTGIHTDMLRSEYTITLDAGSHLNRFYIAVDPDRTATSVENVGEEAKGKGVKYLIDGQLFIRTAEGIFDAQGRKF